MKGACRPVNEDSFACASLAVAPDLSSVPIFFAVADGMGGQAAGQRASRVATRSMVSALGTLAAGKMEASPEAALRDSILRAHLDLLEGGRADPASAGMATTLTAALVLWPRAHVVHVGDSRCYHLRRGALRRLTKDHTVAELLVARGQLSARAARTSRYRHILWNHLGGDARMPHGEATAVILEPGDALLFATDGLTGGLGESELAEIASRPCSAYAVCHMLVEAARARGGHDDATALFVRFSPSL